MPPAILQDEEVASVLNYVLRNWGNAGPEVTSEQVKKVRATTAYPTFEALQQANRYPPLPKAPEGFRLREVARLPFRPVRITSEGRGQKLYVLTEQGVTGSAYLFGYTPVTLRPLLSLIDEIKPDLIGKTVVPVARMQQLEQRLHQLKDH